MWSLWRDSCVSSHNSEPQITQRTTPDWVAEPSNSVHSSSKSGLVHVVNQWCLPCAHFHTVLTQWDTSGGCFEVLHERYYAVCGMKHSIGEESSPWERFHCPICIVMPPRRRGQRDTFLILLLTTDDISLAPGLSSYFGWYVRKKVTDNRMRQIGLFRVHLPYIICSRMAHRHRGRYYESFLTTAELDNNSSWRHRQWPEGGVR